MRRLNFEKPDAKRVRGMSMGNIRGALSSKHFAMGGTLPMPRYKEAVRAEAVRTGKPLAQGDLIHHKFAAEFAPCFRHVKQYFVAHIDEDIADANCGN